MGYTNKEDSDNTYASRVLLDVLERISQAARVIKWSRVSRVRPLSPLEDASMWEEWETGSQCVKWISRRFSEPSKIGAGTP